jgi:hypothetical protein
MRFTGLLAAWTATMFLAAPAYGWNATGHRLVAAIAYARLTSEARARVDDLLRKHADYNTLLAENAPSDPAGRARAAFINASVWPDVIKGDTRFWDDTKADAQPTPQLPGFPDMKRHTNWHYFDTPYAPDGAPTEIHQPPHALTELPRIIKEIRKAPKKAVNPSYDLPWLIHIEGDLHQPLHCVGRFVKSAGGKGDAGGNAVFIAPQTNLHSIWDSAAGRDTTDEFIAKTAAEIVAKHPAPKRLDRDPKTWIDEGLLFCVREVYTFGVDNGTKEKPNTLPAGYLENAQRVAHERIALAGYRLAAILNKKLN